MAVMKNLGSRVVRQNTTVFVSYLLCRRRHVSAAVGHLQVTKMYMRKTTQCTIISSDAYFKLSTKYRCRFVYRYRTNIISYK